MGLTASVVLVALAVGASSGVEVQVGVGPSYVQVRDGLVRGLRWGGPGVGLAVEGVWEGEGVRQRVGFGVPGAVVRNRYGHTGAALGTGLGYEWVRAVAGLGGGVVGVGGAVQGQLAWQYYVDWDEEHLYWATAYDVAPVVAWSRGLGVGRRVRAEVAVPLGAWVSRPPEERTNKVDALTSPGFYFAAAHRDGRLATWPEHAAVRAELALVQALGGGWSAGVAWGLGWRRLASPRPVTLLSQQLQVTVAHAL